MEKAEKFLGVSLAEEKEIILIVAKTSQKNEIMKAIMEQVGKTLGISQVQVSRLEKKILKNLRQKV